ncbi:hypothetical protein [Aliamphritea ceti]|uniref:hypothetical protein n=1 Tax=Aliamphritea ceti TaxID=1524258 RepID=UPI0021C2D8CA|nr:hypothetical protein [Aliamphritea ceti]
MMSLFYLLVVVSVVSGLSALVMILRKKNMQSGKALMLCLFTAVIVYFLGSSEQFVSNSCENQGGRYDAITNSCIVNTQNT